MDANTQRIEWRGSWAIRKLWMSKHHSYESIDIGITPHRWMSFGAIQRRFCSRSARDGSRGDNVLVHWKIDCVIWKSNSIGSRILEFKDAQPDLNIEAIIFLRKFAVVENGKPMKLKWKYSVGSRVNWPKSESELTQWLRWLRQNWLGWLRIQTQRIQIWFGWRQFQFLVFFFFDYVNSESIESFPNGWVSFIELIYHSLMCRMIAGSNNTRNPCKSLSIR